MNNDREIINQLTKTLLMDYKGVYYVNAITNKYICCSVDEASQTLHIIQSGDDFFKDLAEDVDKVIFEADRHIFKQDMTRTNFLLQLEKGTAKNIEYRYILDGTPVYYTLRLLKGPCKGNEYFILGVKNIDDEVRHRQQEQAAPDDMPQEISQDAIGDKLAQGKITPIPEERKIILDRLFEALSAVSDGSYIFVCDVRHNYSRWSKATVAHFNIPSEYMYCADKVWSEKLHPDDKVTFMNAMKDVFSGRTSSLNMQYRAMRFDGQYDLCTCHGIILRDTNGNCDYFCGSAKNHSVHGRIDQLTGLRNQYGFFEDIQWALDNKKTGRIMLVGISKFSEINEIYGYDFGNKILQNFGRYIFKHTGYKGAVYRLDGTKFAIITRCDLQELKEMYAELRAAFRAGSSVEGREIILDLNASVINVDNFNVDYRTVYSCLNFAYAESKQRKQGDLVEFCNNISDENKHRIERFHVIRASIMKEYSGFYLLYQPVVDSRTEKLIGAEALLRWRNDEYGVVPPDDFIPLLEKDPLFPDLGEWIIKTALLDAKKILEKCPDFTVNVNLSYTQLEKADFVDMVERVLNETNYPPNHLCFEITERCRLLDMELLKNISVNLRGKGVRIALDDFGTGFSSIGIVKSLPFDYIKIDRSFVRSIEIDGKERELIKSFVGLALTFDAQVCVEGIETAGMRDILQSYNVHSFQGYYYAKPLEFKDFLSWKDNYIPD